MNQGKICVSVCGETADEVVEKMKSAEPLADVIEIRFDCLDPDQIGPLLDQVSNETRELLITFRPTEHGGRRSLTLAERIKFWEMALSKLAGANSLIDYEFDMDFPLRVSPERAIVSVHDFKTSGHDLPQLVKAMSDVTGKTLKVAVTVDDAGDAVEVWKLLGTTAKGLIPIAMGEAGKWTRILGLAYGSALTYASLEEGKGTAPGQITAKDLAEVFRVKELDPETQVYGVVAGDTSYSLSPYMHNAAFKAAGLNSVFVPLQVRDLNAFIGRMVRGETRDVDLNIGGLSVTNPHKQTIIPLLDEVDPTAQAIGAVNTVKVIGDKLIGFNTDAGGFIAPLERRFVDLNGIRVAVAGAGGAARACVYALKRAGADVTLLARNVEKASSFADEFGVAVQQLATDHRPLDTDILVNATPLGTRGSTENETVATADELRDVKLVYDLVYNPTETRLLREAKTAGVETLGGLDMLVAQGVKQFEIWTGLDAPLAPMRLALEKRLQ